MSAELPLVDPAGFRDVVVAAAERSSLPGEDAIDRRERAFQRFRAIMADQGIEVPSTPAMRDASPAARATMLLARARITRRRDPEMMPVDPKEIP